MRPKTNSPIIFAALLLTAAVVFFCGCQSATRDFYVAPDGADSNPGTRTAPFASAARAVAAVREYRSAAADPLPVSVLFREGRYTLESALLFTPADSGSAQAPVTYASCPGETATLSGGRALSGTWSKVPDREYWQLPIPEAANRGINFFSLYVAGESRIRARTPNWGEKVFRAAGQEPGGDPRQSLQYCAGDVDPAWTNPHDIDVVLLCSWTPTLHRVTAIVHENRTLRFVSTHTRNVEFWERNFRYYLSNVFEALDTPGEWYLNRDSGILYYYPLPGEEPDTLEFIVPVLKSSMMQFNADLAGRRYIQHLHFRNLEFRHTDGDMDRHNGVYRQGHMFLSSAVSATGLQNASFEGCVFAQLGEYALELADGCRDVTVAACHFWDIGAGAIQTGVTDLGTLKKPAGDNPLDQHGCSPERRVERITIRDNYIHKLGTVWHGCYAIVNRFASYSRIVHNEIFDIHWDAVGLDARWEWQGYNYCEGNEVAYNHLHHLGLGYHTDAAGVYQFGPLDTHIHHNRIHDATAYPYICGYAGIYLDQQSRGALVENNLVYNTDWYALFQHKGVDNTFRNNLCAFSRDGLIARGSRSDTWQANHMEAYRNIYISTNSVMIGRDWDDGDRPPLLASNLYHCCAQSSDLIFGNGSFEEWRKRGRDIGSVIAPSGCRDPLAYDFFLAPDAAACTTIGFVPFNDEIARAGMTRDRSRIKLPPSYTPRRPVRTWTREELLQFATFDLDFDAMKPGAPPSGIRQQGGTGKAGFFVTREVAAYRGKACLKVVDCATLPKPFYPYLSVDKLRNLRKTPVHFTFAFRHPAEKRGSMHLEFRGDRGTSEAGPALSIARDGTVTAGGRAVATVKPEQWLSFKISFGLAEERTGRWELSVTDSEGTRTFSLPFKHADFDDVSWIGLMADSHEESFFYLDDLSFKFGDH